jgi:hypothetical protein
MKTTQGWGWLTAGVLALGLNGIYHDGGAAWAHRIANRVVQQTESMGALASVRGDRFLEQTNLAVVRDGTASCRLSTAMARFQTRIARTQNGMAHFEAMSARQEAALARMEANRARIEAQVAGVRLAPVAFDSIEIPVVACPRVRVNVPRVIIPKVPMVKIPAPVVVEMKGSGPV